MSFLKALRNEAPPIFPLFGPILISQYAQIANGIIDSVMIARLNTTGLGGVALGVALWLPVYMFALGVLFSVLILISQYNGEEDEKNILKTGHQGMWMGLILGLFSSAFVFVLLRHISWFGAADELISPAHEYISMIIWGLPAGCLAVSLRFYCEGQNIVFPVTVMAIIMVCINTFLNYCFIFGNFGMSAMGVAGCGLATAISMAFFLLMIVGYIRFSKKLAPKRFFNLFYLPNLDSLKKLFKIGLPIGFGVTSEFLIFSVITLFISANGVAAVAAHQISFNSMLLFFATPTALCIAASIRIGYLKGINDSVKLRQSITSIMTLSAFIGIFFTIIMVLYASDIARIFSPDPTVIIIATSIIKIAAFFQLADSLQVCLNGILRGIGDTIVPFGITAIIYWLFCLPLGYILAGMPLPLGLGVSPDFLGIRGWWVALTISLAIVALVLALRVRKTFWYSTKTVL